MRKLVALILPALLILMGSAASRADVKISSLNNLALGTWGGSGDIERTDNVCVFNDGGTNYTIQITATGNSFSLSNGSHGIPYTVRFNDTPITHGGAPATFSGANTQYDNCSDDPGNANATLKVTVASSDLSGAPASSGYNSTLTVVLGNAP